MKKSIDPDNSEFVIALTQEDLDALAASSEIVQDCSVPEILSAADIPYKVLDQESYLPITSSGQGINAWDPRMLFDIAIEVDSISTILDKYHLSAREFDLLRESPSFNRALSETIREVKENGSSFKAKARVQAEHYLLIVDEIIQDVGVAAATKLSAINSVVKWGGLEPGKVQDGSESEKTTVNIQINI